MHAYINKINCVHKPVKSIYFLNWPLNWKLEKKNLQHCTRYLLTWRRITQVSKCNQDFSSSPISPFFSPLLPSPSPYLPSASISVLENSFLIDAQSHTQDIPLDAPHSYAFGKNFTQFGGHFIWFSAYILHDFPLIINFVKQCVFRPTSLASFLLL